MKIKPDALIYAITDSTGTLVKKPAGNRFYVSEHHAKKQCGFYNDPNISAFHKPDGGRKGPYSVVRFRLIHDKTYEAGEKEHAV